MALIEHALYGRKISVTISLPEKGSLVGVGDRLITLTDLRISFEVEQNLRGEPNTANIYIYNISPANRKLIYEKGSHVSLSVGYGNSIDVVFTGDLQNASTRKDGPDFITQLDCKDSQRTIAHSSARKSFKGGVKVKEIIKYLTSTLGLDLSSNTKKVIEELKSEYTNGKVLSGKSADILDKVLRDHDLEWSVQNGRLQILKFGDADEVTPVIVLNSSTGMVGSPEDGTPDKVNGKKVITVSSLLQPAIYPGKVIKITSSLITTNIKASKVTHTGDTHSSDWFSKIEGKQY